MPSSEPRCVVFADHGISFLRAVVAWVADLEARGATFERLPDGRFKVKPADVLTDSDRAFLREYREEARRFLDFQQECLSHERIN